LTNSKIEGVSGYFISEADLAELSMQIMSSYKNIDNALRIIANTVETQSTAKVVIISEPELFATPDV
jgi:hypothetical protein